LDLERRDVRNTYDYMSSCEYKRTVSNGKVYTYYTILYQVYTYQYIHAILYQAIRCLASGP
jgi:hypothetical protein